MRLKYWKNTNGKMAAGLLCLLIMIMTVLPGLSAAARSPVRASGAAPAAALAAPVAVSAAAGQPQAAGSVTVPAEAGQTEAAGGGQKKSTGGKVSAGDFDIQVKAGLDGKYLYAMPMPVQVRIMDRESDFEGTFRFIIPGSTYGSKPVAYETPLLLTKGSEKLISLTVNELSMMDKPRIQILDASGRTAAQTMVTITGNASEGVLCGVLSDDFASLGYLKYVEIEADGSMSSVDLAELDENSFPDQENMLECLSYIVISDFDTSSLNDGQLKALVKWVKRGGILICASGSEYRRVLSGLEEPLTAEGLSLKVSSYDGRNTDASGQQGQADAADTLIDLPSAKSLVQIEASDGEQVKGIVTDRSLVTAAALGRGGIAFTGFSLSMEPVASLGEESKQQLAHNLLNKLPASLGVGDIQRGSGQTGYIYDTDTLNNAFESVVPNMSLIEILLILFCLLTGPVIYLILKKVDKRGLLWLLIPVSSLVITGLIFFTNRQLWMGSIRTASLTVVSLEDGEAVQEPKVSMLIESPSIGSGKIRFSPDMDHLICGAPDPDMYYPGSGMERKDYDFNTAISYTGEGYEMTALAERAFEHFYVGMDDCGEDSFNHPFEADLECDPGKIKGTLVNRSGKDFTSVCIVNGSFYMDLGPMEAGAKIVLDQIPVSTLNYESFYDAQFQAFDQYSADYNAYVNIMSTLTESYLDIESLTDLYICAYTEDWEADYIRNEDVKEFNRAMVIDHTNVFSDTYPDGYLVRCSDTQYAADQDSWWDNYQGIQKVKVTFMVGSSLMNGKIIGMYLDTSNLNYSGEPLGTMTLYNFRTQTYEDPFKNESFITFDGECPYLGSEGLEVRAEYTTAPGVNEGPTPILYLIGGDGDAEN